MLSIVPVGIETFAGVMPMSTQRTSQSYQLELKRHPPAYLHRDAYASQSYQLELKQKKWQSTCLK